MQQQQQQCAAGLTSVAPTDEELMVVQQQQAQQQQLQQQASVPSYSDYAASFDAVSLGQMPTATVSAVEPDTSRIDELVAPLSTTTAIMSSVTALEQSAIYMDSDASYAVSMKDSRGLLNEQTNVCKVRCSCSLLIDNFRYKHIF